MASVRLRESLTGERVLFLLAAFACWAALFRANLRWWEGALLFLAGSGFFCAARGIARLHSWARHLTAGLCAGVVLLELLNRRLTPFGLYFLGVAVYLELPSTSERFRRARAARE